MTEPHIEVDLIDSHIDLTDSQAALHKELSSLLNRYSQENGSDTPDFILAQFMFNSLKCFDAAVRDREQWYGRRAGAGAAITIRQLPTSPANCPTCAKETPQDRQTPEIS